MRKACPGLFFTAAVVVLLALLGQAALVWPPRSAGAAPGLALMAPILFFWLAGCAGVLLLFPQLERLNGLLFPLLIVIGQLLLGAYYYGRSLIAEVASRVAGVALPISTFELVLLVCVLFIFCARRRPVPVIAPGAGIWSLLAALALVLILAQRELPRDIALSSDPDQHAYWAQQLLRFGRVPWSQGRFGPESFHYPAAFAVLNALWTQLSGRGVVEVVTIMPLIQAQLGIIAAAFGALALVPARCTPRAAALLFLSVSVLYYRLLPYGYQRLLYHSEGAGKASALAFEALVLFAPLLVGLHWRSLADRPRAARGVLLLLAITAAFLADLNPAMALVPFGCLGGILIAVVLAARWTFRARLAAVLTAGLPIALLMLAEPYYVERLLGQHQAASIVPQTAGSGLPPLSTALRAALSGLFNLPSSELLQLLSGGLIAPPAAGSLFGLLAAGLALLAAFAPALRRSALGLMLAAALTVVIALLGKALFRQFSGGDLYLLAPYFEAACAQYLYLWFFAAFGMLFVHFAQLGLRRLVPACGAAAVAVLVLGPRPAREQYTNLAPRFGYCGAMGCVTGHDRALLEFAARHYAAVRRKYGDLPFERAPKVLIPNAPVYTPPERWLFPSGASRVLPLAETFPPAFFYFQGARYYSYDNYLAHVCRQLDLDWLRRRNIRYLFLPEQKAQPCVSGLDRLMADPGRILFRSGPAMFIKLF